MSDKLFLQQLIKQNSQFSSTLPDKAMVHHFVDDLFGYLFIPKTRKQQLSDLEKEWQSLKSHLNTLIYDVTGDGKKSQLFSDRFFEELPAIYEVLQQDAASVLENDPAATSIEEVYLAYPGFYAITIYRFANQLWKSGIEILPRLFTEYAHSKTGIDIHPGATIGLSFFIDHGTGVVIGETSVIGNHVKIYQGVTIGALNSAKGKADKKRHPTIEDNVIIYSGATILGGKTVIGRDSVIGGNVWITYNVPPSSLVYHKSEVVAKADFSFKASVDEILNPKKKAVKEHADQL
jgi:serine O-acetyltransferase